MNRPEETFPCHWFAPGTKAVLSSAPASIQKHFYKFPLRGSGFAISKWSQDEMKMVPRCHLLSELVALPRCPGLVPCTGAVGDEAWSSTA